MARTTPERLWTCFDQASAPAAALKLNWARHAFGWLGMATLAAAWTTGWSPAAQAQAAAAAAPKEAPLKDAMKPW